MAATAMTVAMRESQVASRGPRNRPMAEIMVTWSAIPLPMKMVIRT